MGPTRVLDGIDWSRVSRMVAAALLVAFVICDVLLLRLVLTTQPLGLDFLPLWTAARMDPRHIYDFGLVSARQAWLYTGGPRPFVYPPSALLFLKPFGAAPYWAAYPAFVALTGALFVWAGRRLKADWRLLLMPAPILLVALAGQVTFLIGGLTMAALTLKNRPLLAGVLFGIAGAIQPQALVLLPLALAVEGNWRAFWTTAATAIVLGLVSIPLGASWPAWIEALPRFTKLVLADPGLAATTVTPFASWGPGSLILSAPVAIAGVWLAFRSDSIPARTLALLGGALLVSPYAMNYQMALLIAPILALGGLALWTLPFWLALMLFPYGPASLMVAMAMLFVSLAARRCGYEGWLSPVPRASGAGS